MVTREYTLMTHNPAFDVSEFDRIVTDAVDRGSATSSNSENMLLAFKKDPNSLSYVESILLQSECVQSQLFAVHIIEDAIKRRWNTLPENIQNNLAIFITKHTQTHKARCIYRKLNECLVMILKLEYPAKYSTFIADIVTMSSKSAGVCANAFDLLSLFNTQMRTNLPTFRKRVIVENFRANFFHVYALVSSVLRGCGDSDVLKCCLLALGGFLEFFSIRHLLECDLIESVIRMLHTAFSTQALSVLAAVIEKQNDVYSQDSRTCENCHLRAITRPDDEVTDLLGDKKNQVPVDAKLAHLARNSAYRKQLANILGIKEDQCGEIGGPCITQKNKPGNFYPLRLQQPNMNESWLGAPNTPLKDQFTNMGVHGIQDFEQIVFNDAPVLTGELPQIYFIQQHAYSSLRCVECVYLSIMQQNFLLSPFVSYTMLTNQDSKDLPLLRDKLQHIHSETISFLKLYFSKFTSTQTKFSKAYSSLPFDERAFVKEFVRLLIAFYETNLFVFDIENMLRGLHMLLKVAKTGDPGLHRQTMAFFGKFTTNLVLSSLYDEQEEKRLGIPEEIRTSEMMHNSSKYHHNPEQGQNTTFSPTGGPQNSPLGTSIDGTFGSADSSIFQENYRSHPHKNTNSTGFSNYGQNDPMRSSNQSSVGRHPDFGAGVCYYSEKIRESLEPVLHALTEVVIDQMPRPEDVYIVKNEFGDVERDFITQTEQLEFISLCQDVLKNCALLDLSFTEIALSARISNLAQHKAGWSHNALSSTCWSAGALSHVLCPEIFFTEALKLLLRMCEGNNERGDKALIASNILFLVAAFDAYLRVNGRFHKTVVRKLFEFMAETFPGVPEMSCDVFLRVAKGASMKALTEDGVPFLTYTVTSLASTTRLSLTLPLRRTLYQALFHAASTAHPPTAVDILALVHADAAEGAQCLSDALRLSPRALASPRIPQCSNSVDAFDDLSCLANPRVFMELLNPATLSAVIADASNARMLNHVLCVYTIFFRILPQLHARFVPFVISIHTALSRCEGTSADNLRGCALTALSALLSAVVPTNALCESLLRNVLSQSCTRIPAYFELAESIVQRCARVQALRIIHADNAHETLSNSTNMASENTQFGFSTGNIFCPDQTNAGNISHFPANISSPFPKTGNALTNTNLTRTSGIKSKDNSFNSSILDEAFRADMNYYIQRETFIIQTIIHPGLINLSKELLILLKSLLIHSTAFFSVLYSTPTFNVLVEKLLSHVNELLISVLCYETLLLLVNNALTTNTFGFFTQFYVQIFETVLAGILEKENTISLDIQSALIKQLITSLRIIPPLGENDNVTYVKCFVSGLFAAHTKHIQDCDIKIFIDGMFALADNHLILRDHVVDFRFKVDSMFLKSDKTQEESVLHERIAVYQKISTIS